MNDIKPLDILVIVSASLTLITTTAWNSLLQDTINYTFPDKNKSITVETLYTITLTFCVSILLYYLINYGKQLTSKISILFK